MTAKVNVLLEFSGEKIKSRFQLLRFFPKLASLDFVSRHISILT